ncbi:MAG: hypothetical protein DMG05_01920 [Acidobacteria bacterium]|nr:MAG: hypothetical protein DMG05_01920 [Acidobacteriota bacterium]
MTSVNNGFLEYQDLKQILTKFADSPLGAQLIEQLAPFSSKIEIQRQFDLTEECLKFLKSGHGLLFNELGDFSLLFEKLGIEGVAINPREILEILGLLLCSQTVKQKLQAYAKDLSKLVEMGQTLPDFGGLSSGLMGKISRSGEVEDHASAPLKKIRNEIGVIRNRLYHLLEQILKRYMGSGVIQDDVITIRNERFVIPVRADNRKELAGVVHGISSSGQTIFLEPLEALELNNQLVQLKELAELEVRNILLALTNEIRERLSDLQTAVRLLASLDFTFAKAKFSQKYKCVIPHVNEGGVLTIVEGRHPILERSLQSQGLEIVPISIDLDGTRHILVISGPNTGGKTVALKTVGLLTLMGLSGIPVPAVAADICILHQVFADIGDHQSILENLSTFSSHLLNIKEILERVSAPALVLLDELGSGTDPVEGSALGVAIVESLREKGIIAVVTTHHNGLKMYAAKTPRVSNASVEFDETILRPTFRLIHGIPGNSSGIEIARRLGLEASLILHAQQLVSKEEQEIAEYSQQLRVQIEKTAKIREELEREQRNLEQDRRHLEKKHKEIEEKQKKDLEHTWRQTYEEFEKESRQLISEIQDKYLAVRARREIDRKAVKLKEKVSQQWVSHSKSSSDGPSEALTTSSLLAPGTKVVVKKFRQEGTVVNTLKDGRLEIAVGSLRCVVNPFEIEPRQSMKFLPEEEGLRLPARVTLQINSPEPQTNEINLIGCTVDEAISRADKFLDMAYLASILQVRLIHGSGMGILRKAISEWLWSQPHVGTFRAATANEGGNGVTIVSLKV